MDSKHDIFQKYGEVLKLFPDIDLIGIIQKLSWVNDILVKLDQSLDDFYSRTGFSEEFLANKKNRGKLSLEDHEELLKAEDLIGEIKFMQQYLFRYFEAIENCRIELKNHFPDDLRKKYKKIFEELEDARIKAIVQSKAQEAMSQEIIQTLKEGKKTINQKRLQSTFKKLAEEARPKRNKS